MEKTELQKMIMEKHLANDFPLLKKYHNNSLSSGIDFFSSSYELSGLVPFDRPEEQKYLPHFEFNVITYYSIKIPDDAIHESVCEYTDDAVKAVFKPKDGKSSVEVTFPLVRDLFQLRNLKSGGKLLDVLKIKEEDKGKLHIDKSQFELGFTFRASSTTFGQLYGFMDISHPKAEELIKEYLETIDKRFADYAGLKEHFREKDDKGNILYESEGLQSKEYNSKRSKLHKAMFGDLKKVLKKGNMKIKDATDNTLSARICMLMQYCYNIIHKKQGNEPEWQS